MLIYRTTFILITFCDTFRSDLLILFFIVLEGIELSLVFASHAIKNFSRFIFSNVLLLISKPTIFTQEW